MHFGIVQTYKFTDFSLIVFFILMLIVYQKFPNSIDVLYRRVKVSVFCSGIEASKRILLYYIKLCLYLLKYIYDMDFELKIICLCCIIKSGQTHL